MYLLCMYISIYAWRVEPVSLLLSSLGKLKQEASTASLTGAILKIGMLSYS